MASKRRESLSGQALVEAKRARKLQVSGLAIAVVALILSVVLPLVLFRWQQTSASAQVTANICPAIMLKESNGVLTDCISPGDSVRLPATENAVRVDFANNGGGGITVNSISLICADLVKCGMYNIATDGGQSDGSPGDLPKYLSSGQSSFFAMGIACDYSALGGGLDATTEIKAVLNLSSGKTITTSSIPVLRPTKSQLASCNKSS